MKSEEWATPYYRANEPNSYFKKILHSSLFILHFQNIFVTRLMPATSV